jgi:anthranilate synthase component 2
VKLLIVDNNDSFTYNLVQIIAESNLATFDVKKHDQIELSSVDDYDKILFSPGPSLPDDFPIMKKILASYGATKSILGICMGLQAIAEFYGGKLSNLENVVHGQKRMVYILKDDVLFNEIDDQFQAGLYHSWAVADDSFPSCLEISSRSEINTIMSVYHKEYDIKGVQFHPESIITEVGTQIIQNWLNN